MAYTLAQIYGALGAVEHGQDMISDLQGIIAKGAKQDKSGEILKKLGVNTIEEVDNLVSVLAAVKKTGNDPATLASQLTDLSTQVNDFKAKFEESEAKRKEERTKRINSAIKSQLISELTKGNALMPETFAQVLAANVQAKDDDSLIYKSADGKEIAVADGVKAWLQNNPSAVKVGINGGAGSSGGKMPPANNATVEQLGKMSMEEYIKYRNEHK